MSPFESQAVNIRDAATVVAAFLAYVLFIAVGSAVRIGSGKKPSVPFNRLHFRMTWVYLTLGVCSLWLAGIPVGFSWPFNLAIGAFFYFGLHYAIFANFFGMAHASVSTSIISIVYRRGGTATRQEVVDGYAGGQGFDYIKRSRLDRLEVFLRWIEREPTDSNRYRVTAAGLKAVRIMRFFLRSWSLTQLGGKS